MKGIVSVAVSTFLLTASFAFAGDGDQILGLWTTPKDECKIEILKCGDTYCGRIAWLKEPYYSADDDKGMAGQPIVDRENPNPRLRARPLIGLQLLEGFRYVAENVWEKGPIYNPDDGGTYKCRMRLSGPSRLEVRGFVMIPIFGGSSVWMR